jgi:hypothetical protein
MEFSSGIWVWCSDLFERSSFPPSLSSQDHSSRLGLDEPVSTCLWQDIWQVMSLDGLWIQYTQAG